MLRLPTISTRMPLFSFAAVGLLALSGCATEGEPHGSLQANRALSSSASADDTSSTDVSASAEDAPGIVSVSAVGSGCSAEHTFVDLHADGTSALVSHTVFNEARVDEHTSEAKTDCQLIVHLRDTGRHRYRVHSDRDAIVFLEKGQTAQITEQARVGHAPMASTERTSELVGPYDNMYKLVLEAETACGDAQEVHFGAAIHLQRGETRREGTVSLGMDDAAIEVYARIAVTAIPCVRLRPSLVSPPPPSG